MQHIPVLIVGAGPTGLIAAITLARFGIDFRIIDQKARPTETSNALAIHARTFRNLGRLRPSKCCPWKMELKFHGMNIYMNGEPVFHGVLSDLETPTPFVLGIAQSCTENLLTKKLSEYDKQVERPVSITQYSKANYVIATLTHGEGAEQRTEQISTDWVIACDGAHSFIRHALELPFEAN